MRYTLVTTKEVPDGGSQRASGILYLETVAEPLDWPSQGFKEYRYDQSTRLTFDASVISHICLYFPTYIFSVSCSSTITISLYIHSIHLLTFIIYLIS